MSEEFDSTAAGSRLEFECTVCGQSFPPAEVYNKKGSIVCIRCFTFQAAQNTTRRSVTRALASIANARGLAKVGAITLGAVILLSVNIPIGYLRDRFWWQFFDYANPKRAITAIGFFCGYMSLAAVAVMVLGVVMSGTTRAVTFVVLAGLPLIASAVGLPILQIRYITASVAIFAIPIAFALLIVARCRWVAPVDPRARIWQFVLAICLSAFIAMSIGASAWVDRSSHFVSYVAWTPEWITTLYRATTMTGYIAAAVGAAFSLVQLRGVSPITTRIIWVALALYLVTPILWLVVHFTEEYQRSHAILINGMVMFYARLCVLLYCLVGLIVIALNETLISNYFSQIVDPESSGAFPVLPLAATVHAAAAPQAAQPIPSNPPPT